MVAELVFAESSVTLSHFTMRVLIIMVRRSDRCHICLSLMYHRFSECLVLILVDCVLKKSCYRLSINVKNRQSFLNPKISYLILFHYRTGGFSQPNSSAGERPSGKGQGHLSRRAFPVSVLFCCKYISLILFIKE